MHKEKVLEEGKRNAVDVEDLVIAAPIAKSQLILHLEKRMHIGELTMQRSLLSQIMLTKEKMM